MRREGSGLGLGLVVVGSLLRRVFLHSEEASVLPLLFPGSDLSYKFNM
jgi:hypothetical protein